MGNIKNSERYYRGKEGKWVGKIGEGDKTWKTPNSTKRTRGSGRGGEWGMRWLGDGHWGGTWQDEHWVLYYMLANRTPIKKYTKKKSDTECWLKLFQYI